MTCVHGDRAVVCCVTSGLPLGRAPAAFRWPTDAGARVHWRSCMGVLVHEPRAYPAHSLKRWVRTWAEIIPLRQCLASHPGRGAPLVKGDVRHCLVPERDHAREGNAVVTLVTLGQVCGTWTDAADMSGSLLQSYPQLALIPNAGVLGLAAYAFSTIAPVWAFAFFGPFIRRLCPDGFTLSEFIRRRYGWPIGVLSAMVFIGFMFCFMMVELNTYGSVIEEITGLSYNRVVGPLIIAITTTIYTAYGGFKASLYTDNVNAVIVIIFVILGAVAIAVKLPVTHERIESSGLLQAHSLGGQLWYILTISIIFSQMFNQGFWQRAFASRNNATLYLSVALATIPLFAIVFLVGMAGPLAQWGGVQDPIDQATGTTANDPTDDGSFALFHILESMPNWIQGVVLVLAGVLSSSAYDTFQSAQISVIENDLFLGRLNIWYCRVLLFVLNVPCVVLAIENIDILQVFVIADLIGLAVIPCIFIGLPRRMHFYNAFDVVAGGCGGFLTIWIFGTIFYRDAKQGATLFSLPNGLYVEDYSVLGAFFAAPLGCIGFALASCGLRLLVLKLYSLATGKPFTALDAPEWDPTSYALPEDRPSLFGLRKSGNVEDGRKLQNPEKSIERAEFSSFLHNWRKRKDLDDVHPSLSDVDSNDKQLYEADRGDTFAGAPGEHVTQDHAELDEHRGESAPEPSAGVSGTDSTRDDEDKSAAFHRAVVPEDDGYESMALHRGGVASPPEADTSDGADSHLAGADATHPTGGSAAPTRAAAAPSYLASTANGPADNLSYGLGRALNR